MLRLFGTGLPSDAITHRYGFEGNEPREMEWLHRKYASLGIRSTFAINTFYQEIAGGYYVNRALFLLIDMAMRAIGVFPVILDVWRSDGLVPVEGTGQLLEQEQYILATEDQKQIGVLQIWQFHAGGGGRYYGDNIIFDLIMPDGLAARLVDEVESKCRDGSVRFDRTPPVG